jgi:hypothetical protein
VPELHRLRCHHLDAGNLRVCDSGIIMIHGGIRNGDTIRFRTISGGNRTFRLRVEQLPGEDRYDRIDNRLQYSKLASVGYLLIRPGLSATLPWRIRSGWLGP